MNKPSRVIRILALALLAALLLTACKTPEPADQQEPTPSPSPTQAQPVWTPVPPDPTITPRPMENIEYPEAGATAILIDPYDKPTPKPLVFTYAPVSQDVVNTLGITFEVPAGWEAAPLTEGSTAKFQFQEPLGAIQNDVGVQALAIVAAVDYTSTRTPDDATAFLNDQITQLRESCKANNWKLEVSSPSPNQLMGKDGTYVSYWIDEFDTTLGTKVRVRGRLHVAAIDRKIYMIRTLWPTEFNTEYDDKVYKQIRKTMIIPAAQ